MKGFHIQCRDARMLLERILHGAGLCEEYAFDVADNLVAAEERGIASHGMSRMGVYCERISSGAINPNARLGIVEDRLGALVLDAQHGPGQAMAKAAMRMVMDRAATQGIAMAVVRNGSHFGMAAYYSMMALERGMIGVAMTNAPPVMCPWGSRETMLGTNPVSVAMPALTRPGFVFDSASSVVARGKIILAEREGRAIPPGWALDPEGRPTTDAAEALRGSVMPFGGYKGSGIALIIDLLCAMLSGADSSSHVKELYNAPDTPQNLGFCLMALNIAAFTDVEQFKQRMDQIISEIKAAEPAEGVGEILIPGEPELIRQKKILREGIPVSENLRDELVALAGQYAPEIRASELFGA